MTHEDVDNHFKNSTACGKESEETRMVYVLAVRLHKLGYLDAHNRPVDRFLAKSQRACSPLPVPSSLKVPAVVKQEHVHHLRTASSKHGMVAGADRVHKRTALPDAGTESQHSGAAEHTALSDHVLQDAAQAAQGSSSHCSVPATVTGTHNPNQTHPSAVTAAPNVTVPHGAAVATDHKSLLNVHSLTAYNVPPTYETSEKDAHGMFHAVARITPLDAQPHRVYTAQGEPCRKKKHAQQSAAEVLMRKITQASGSMSNG